VAASLTYLLTYLLACGGIENRDRVHECGPRLLLDDAVVEDSEGDRRVMDVRVRGDRGHGALNLVWPGDAEVDRGREAVHDAEDVAGAEVGLPLHRLGEQHHGRPRSLR